MIRAHASAVDIGDRLTALLLKDDKSKEKEE